MCSLLEIAGSESLHRMGRLLSRMPLSLASDRTYVIFREGSVNRWVLTARAACKNVLITKDEILRYIKLKFYTVGNIQDQEFLDPRQYYG